MTSRAITVFGSAQPAAGSVGYEQARDLGRLLTQAGFAVVNGGYTGTMEGVSRGVTEAGGRVIGVTCALFDRNRPAGNPYLTETVHSPDLLARLRTLVERGDGFVVLNGGVGTLLELFLIWNLLAIEATHKPCILLGTRWQRVLEGLAHDTAIESRHISLLRVADTPADAVHLLKSALKS